MPDDYTVRELSVREEMESIWIRLQGRAEREGATLEEPRLPAAIESGEIAPRYRWRAEGKPSFGERFARTPWVKTIPGVRLGYETAETGHIILLANNLKDFLEQPGLPEEERAAHWFKTNPDAPVLERFIVEQEEARVRGEGIGSRAADIIARLPAFAIEFAMSGLAAKAGRVGVKAAARKVLGAAARRGVGKVAVKGLGWAAAGAARAGVLSFGVAEATARRQIPQFAVGPSGGVEVIAPEEGWAESFLKGYVEQTIEYMSEEAGAAIGRRLSKIPAIKRLRGIWGDSAARRTVFARMLAKGGFHGMPEEMVEERLGAAMRAATGLGEWSEINPGFEQLAAEALAFSVPGGARAAVGAVARIRGGPREEVHREFTSQLVAQIDESVRQEEVRASIETITESEEAGGSARNLARRAMQRIEQGQDVSESLARRLEGEAGTVQRKERLAAETPPPATDYQQAIGELADAARDDPQVIARVRREDPGWAEDLEQAVKQRAAEPFGSRNTIFPQDKFEEARRKFIEEIGGAQFAGIPISPAALKDLAVVAGYYVEGGVRKFGDFAAKMHSDLREWVGPSFASNKAFAAWAGPQIGALWRDTKKLRAELGKVEKAERKARKALVSAPRIKRAVRRTVRWKEGEPVSVTPRQLLRHALKKAAAAARVAFREGKEVGLQTGWLRGMTRGLKQGYFRGQVTLQHSHKELAERIQAALPEGEYKLAAKALDRAMKTRTNSEIRRVLRAVDLMIETHKKREAIRRFKSAVKSTRNLRPNIQKQADDLASEFALSMPTKATRQRMESLLAAVDKDELAKLGVPARLVARAKEVLAQKDKKYIYDLTSGELDAVTSALESLVHMSEAENKLLASYRQRRAKEMVLSAVRETRARLGDKYAEDKTPSTGLWGHITRTADRVTKLPRWLAVRAQLSYLTEIEDLAAEDSMTYQILFGALRDGQTDFISLISSLEMEFQTALKAAGLTYGQIRNWSKDFAGVAHETEIQLPEARGEDGRHIRVLKLTPAEKISLALHFMDDSTRAELLKDSGKGFIINRKKKAGYIKPTVRDAKAILDSLTPDERKVADIISGLVNGTLRDALNAAWRRMYGTDIAKDLDLKYWPRQRDGEYQESDPNKMVDFWVDKILEHLGIFLPRSTSPAPIEVRDAFDVFFNHGTKVNSFIAKAAPIHDAMRLLRNHDFKQAVRKGYKNGDELLREWEQVIGEYSGMAPVQWGKLAMLVRKFTRNVHRGALGLKPQIIAYQTVSYQMAANEIEEKYLLRAASVTSTRQLQEEIDEWQPDIAARIRGSFHGALTPTAGASSETMRAFFGESEGFLTKVSLGPIHWADTQVMYRLWQAAKLEGMDKGLQGEQLMRYTADRARYLVDTTQPSWDILTVSALAREAKKSPLAGLAIMFSSQRNKLFNMSARAVSEFRHSERQARDYLRLVGKIANAQILNAMLIYALQFGVRRLFVKPDDDDKDPATHIGGVLDRIFSNWLVIGDALQAVRKVAMAKPQELSFFEEPRGTVVYATSREWLRFLGDMRRAIEGGASRYQSGPLAGEKKSMIAMWRAAEHLARATSLTFGVPLEGAMFPVRQELPHRRKRR